MHSAFFFRFRTAFDGRRSTQAWLHNLAPFQVFVDTSVIQDKTLTIYINFRKFKLEKASNFVTRPASNVDRRTPFGSEKKCGMHISVKCVVSCSVTYFQFLVFMVCSRDISICLICKWCEEGPLYFLREA